MPRGNFSNDESHRTQHFVRDRNMKTKLPRLTPRSEFAMQHHARAASGGIENFTSAPGHGPVDTQANSLGKGLLGGEARSEIALAASRCPRVSLAEDFKFLLAKNALGKTPAMALPGAADAANLADVGTDAVDAAHHDAAAVRAKLARMMTALKSRTDCSMPTNTAWPTSACPMCSSRISGMAAMLPVLDSVSP